MMVSTLAILTALQARLEALEIAPEVPAFEKVEIYSHPNLIRALQDLRIFKSRVCLIVPDGETYENEVHGRNLVTKCVRQVILLFADRDFGRRQDAATGDDSTPGVIRLNEAIATDLTGQSLGLGGVRIIPEFSQPVLLADKDRDRSAGREAWHLELSIEAGVRKTTVP